MKDLLRYLVENLAEKPEEISIEEEELEGESVFKLRVAPEDMGRIIGAGGRMAKDLRLLMRTAARDGRRVNVEIVE